MSVGILNSFINIQMTKTPEKAANGPMAKDRGVAHREMRMAITFRDLLHPFINRGRMKRQKAMWNRMKSVSIILLF